MHDSPTPPDCEYEQFMKFAKGVINSNEMTFYDAVRYCHDNDIEHFFTSIADDETYNKVRALNDNDYVICYKLLAIVHSEIENNAGDYSNWPEINSFEFVCDLIDDGFDGITIKGDV